MIFDSEQPSVYAKKISMMLRYQALVLFVLFDLLFLPRILSLFGVPSSLLVVILYLFWGAVDKVRFLLFLGVACVCLFSVFNGLLVKGDFYLVDDVKRVLQLLTALLYGFVFMNHSQSVVYRLAVLVRIFFLWILLNAIVFIASPESYYVFIGRFYPEALASIEDNIGAQRFSYFFADPNSASYFFCFAMCLYCTIEKNKYCFAISIISAAVAIMATQSRGGYIGFLFILSYLFFRWRLSLPRKFIFLLVLSGIFSSVIYMYSDVLVIVYELYEYRSEAEEAVGLGLGGGRIQKYEYFFSNLNLFPYGVGYSLLKDGLEFRPHSDLIRINFSYGLPLLAILAFFILPRCKEGFLLSVVFSVAFLVNTVIDDYRLFPLYLFASNLIHALSVEASGGLK
jgi:hypothetical protein